jgi:HemK-like putative methylase
MQGQSWAGQGLVQTNRTKNDRTDFLKKKMNERISVLHLLQDLKSLDDKIINIQKKINSSSETGLKLFSFCHEIVPELSRKQLHHLFKREENIILNDITIGRDNENVRTKINDEIQIQISAKEFLASTELFEEILFHFQSPEFCIIEKTAGINAAEKSFFEYVFRLKVWDGFYFHTCCSLYRLEERVGGLMILFPNKDALYQMGTRMLTANSLSFSCVTSEKDQSTTERTLSVGSKLSVIEDLRLAPISTVQSRSLGNISLNHLIPHFKSNRPVSVENMDSFVRNLSADLKRIKNILMDFDLHVIGVNEVGLKGKGLYLTLNEINLFPLLNVETVVQIPIPVKFAKFLEKEKHFKDLKIQKDQLALSQQENSEELTSPMTATDSNTVGTEKPIEYRTNTATFCGLRFYVDENVLIPRKSSEALVKYACSHLSALVSDKITVLDLGTGSGCLLLSVMNYLKTEYCSKDVCHNDRRLFYGRGTDLSEEALQIAQRNSSSLKLDDVCEFFVGDFTDPVSWYLPQFSNECNQSSYDVVLCNPPYSAVSERNRLSYQSREFEPSLALFADDHDPFKYYYKIVEVLLLFEQNQKNALLFHINTIFIIEIGTGQLEKIQSIFAKLTTWKLKDVLKDYKNMNRGLVFELVTL